MSQRKVEESLRLFKAELKETFTLYKATTVLGCKDYQSAMAMLNYMVRVGFLERMQHRDENYYFITDKGMKLINKSMEEDKMVRKEEKSVKMRDRERKIKDFLGYNPWSDKKQVRSYLIQNKHQMTQDATYQVLKTMTDDGELVFRKEGLKNLYALSEQSDFKVEKTAAAPADKPLPKLPEIEIYLCLKPYMARTLILPRQITPKKQELIMETSFKDSYNTIEAFNTLPETIRKSAQLKIDPDEDTYLLILNLPSEGVV